MSKHGMNSQNFANQNKTSSRDRRENMGATGSQPARINPNAGTQQVDKHDQVQPGEERRKYDAKYASGKSDAKKSAGLPEGTADHK